MAGQSWHRPKWKQQAQESLLRKSISETDKGWQQALSPTANAATTVISPPPLCSVHVEGKMEEEKSGLPPPPPSVRD